MPASNNVFSCPFEHFQPFQTHPTMPPATQTALQQAQAQYEMTLLQAERHLVTDTLKTVTTKRKRLVDALARIELGNERWQTPNANLGEMYRLKEGIERFERQARECHRRWDELGEEIEEKHVEIAFGGGGGD